MKQIVRSLLMITPVLISLSSLSQVTQLSNNTNIIYGVQAGGKFVLVSGLGILWTTDGTAAGTMPYTTKVAYDSAGGFAVFNNKIYFSGVDLSNGTELWVTDGTDAGTSRIMDINSGSGSSVPESFVVYNGALYFTADDGFTGRELYKTDGTPGGTSMVDDINPGAAGACDTSQFFVNNNILFFTANDGSIGNELWKIEGTNAPVLLKDITAGTNGTNFGAFAALGTKTIFERTIGAPLTGQLELWATNGTAGNTVAIKNFGDFSAFPVSFLEFNGKLYFAGTDFLTTGTELWSTDGTTEGTSLVKDINPGGLVASSFPILLNAAIINDKFIFTANTANEGIELWISDGTSDGTEILKDIWPGTSSSGAFVLLDFSDGLQHNNLYNGQVFVLADEGTGPELWITDGTAGNTKLVKDINPDVGALDNFNGYFYTSAGLFFAADDGTNGQELWKSDGTESGTMMVADVNAGNGGSSPFAFAIYDNHLYFTADNGDNINGDRDLYIVDETLSPLPVHLLDFTALLNDKAVQLNWTTTTEINSSHFVIQRSKDGVQFDAIGRVNAAGNTTAETPYKFDDAGALQQNATTLYYRLQMVDKDGKYTYSKIAPIHIRPYAGELKVYPNPVRDALLVLYNLQNAAKAGLRISDANGKMLYNQTLNSASNQTSFDVSKLPAGVYYVQLITDKGIQKTKFIKQ